MSSNVNMMSGNATVLCVVAEGYLKDQDFMPRIEDRKDGKN